MQPSERLLSSLVDNTRRHESAPEMPLERAVAAWQALLGPRRVLLDIDATDRYGRSTDPVMRWIAAALIAEETDEVAGIVRTANRHGVPLYPISAGKNWGYGDAIPTMDGCVILDLSRMNKVLALDTDLGLVTVQPGVRQGDLRAYLDEHAPEFMVPTTGGGPLCSLVGNVCERGYGITPLQDHFLAATAVQAVLPDGETYRTPLTEMGALTADRAHKWGVGPYVDGLFTQGNFGIVTEMTLALARRSERVKGFYFSLGRHDQLEGVVEAVQRVLRTCGANVGGINLMNSRRVLAMSIPYPTGQVAVGGVMSPEVESILRTKAGIGAWMGVGAIYGTKRLARAARAEIRALLRPHVDRIVFVDAAQVRRANSLLSALPQRWVMEKRQVLAKAAASLDIMAGTPSQAALPLAYWRSGIPMTQGHLDPARDGCGLIWYSPLVPMRPDDVRRYADLVQQVCTSYGIEPMITLTALSDRCFDSTVPLTFQHSNSDEVARANACHRDLFEAGKRQGFVPYRVGSGHMDLVVEDSTFWSVVATLKRALDPNDVIAPGRYCPRPSGPTDVRTLR
jgi:4-cresol dehydrogenase (hydroxylating) flavoprotein subunit